VEPSSTQLAHLLKEARSAGEFVPYPQLALRYTQLAAERGIKGAASALSHAYATGVLTNECTQQYVCVCVCVCVDTGSTWVLGCVCMCVCVGGGGARGCGRVCARPGVLALRYTQLAAERGIKGLHQRPATRTPQVCACSSVCLWGMGRVFLRVRTHIHCAETPWVSSLKRE
jgi:hypothetical protein